MRLAFDTDVLIYTTVPGHPLGEKVWRILERPELAGKLFGSTLLLPELLSKPRRLGLNDETKILLECLSRLELLPIDAAMAFTAVQLGATYKLKAPDAVHLACAVTGAADAFITNNARDFKSALILEVQIVFPAELDNLKLN